MVETSEGTVDSKLPSIVREQCTCGSSKEDVITGLSGAFDVALQAEDSILNNVEDSSQDDNRCSSDHKKATRIISPEHSVKCLCKCGKSPLTGCLISTSTDNRQEDNTYQHVLSLPVERTLMSAMKGGREKEGLPPRKLSVSWAHDVYDPPPSSVSHLPKRNNQSYRNRKSYLKGKQKSKTSHGSRSKRDKKHHHRKGGETPLGLAFASAKNLPSNYRPSMELHELDNGDECDSPDSSCGTSFLRKSCGSLPRI